MDGNMFDPLFKLLYFLAFLAIVSIGGWIVYGLYHLIKWLF